MSRSTPYQPVILRILHSLSGILVLAAIITGFLVYNTFDKRFGSLPIAKINPIQDIHGTVALLFLLLLPVFSLYSFHGGKIRLLQADSLQKISQPNQFNQPIWWLSLQRLANTFMLIAAVLAVTSGRMMKEEWLPLGELDHIWYYCHLTAWLILICSLAIHLLMSAKVGGAPLLLSMISWQVRTQDSPKYWLTRLRNWSVTNNYRQSLANFYQLLQSNTILSLIELLVILGTIGAFLLPLFFSSGD